MINIQPLITETTLLKAKKNWYTFRVPLHENKNTLKKEIEKLFKVDVLSISSIVIKGKKKRNLRTRRELQKPNWKKIMIKIKEGQKIEVFDVGGEN